MFALQYKTRSKILTTPQKKAFENSMDKGENKQYFSPFPTMFFFLMNSKQKLSFEPHFL